MSLSKIFLSCTLMVFAFTVTSVPLAEAGWKSDKSEKHSWNKSGKSDKSNKSGKSGKSDKSNKSGKSGKSDKSNKSGKSGKSDKSNKSGKSGKSDKSNKSGKSGKSGKSDKSNKSGKSGKSNKSNKPKVDVCHVAKGNGNIILISVSEKGAARHLRRHNGDVLAGEFFLDLDGDGFGDDTMVNSCPIDGYVPTGGDCAVDDGTVSPGAAEVCGDGIDNNCNGEIDEECGIPQTFVDIVGDCDGFGSEQPYSDDPAYFQIAVDEGTDQDRAGAWCTKATPYEWTHNLDELPADAVVTGLTLQVNSYGVDDATDFNNGEGPLHINNRLYVDGVEVTEALDLVSSSNNARVDYIDLPASSADDGSVNISVDPAGGNQLDCVMYDYSELVVEYTSQTITSSPAGGFCQNGDQPSTPVVCPCGNVDDVVPFFQADPNIDEFFFEPNKPAENRVSFGNQSGAYFETSNVGAAGTACRVYSTSGLEVEVDNLNTAEVTACQAEITKLPSLFVILN